MNKQPLRLSFASPRAAQRVLSSRRLALALALLFCVPAHALASSDPVPLSRQAGSSAVYKTSGAFRYHTAECRYLLNHEIQARLATAKLPPATYAESNLVSCMEPGYLQWT